MAEALGKALYVTAAGVAFYVLCRALNQRTLATLIRYVIYGLLVLYTAEFLIALWAWIIEAMKPVVDALTSIKELGERIENMGRLIPWRR